MNSTSPAMHWWRETLPYFEKYWMGNPAFSESKLYKYRQRCAAVKSVRYPTSQGANDPLLTDGFPADPAAALHNEIHSLFQRHNFITNLPLEEVRSQLQPALQLASQFITNDHALEWFVRVRFSAVLLAGDGPGMLIRRAGPITRNMLDTVKADLVGLAGRVPISFAVPTGKKDSTGKGEEWNGCTCHCLSQVLDILQAPQSDIDNSRLFPGNDQRMLLLHVNFFFEAMIHRYYNTTPAQQRAFQLYLALVLVHETAHVWLSVCHPLVTRKGEYIVCSADVFPEAGFSWENFMFGARIRYEHTEAPVLQASTFASRFGTPRRSLTTYVPTAWTNRWFLASTWQDFAQLHSSGALLAPSADRCVDVFFTRRYCAASRSIVQLTFIDGMIDSDLCCDSSVCRAREPGTKERWPADAAQCTALLLELIDQDIAFAQTKGEQIESLIRDMHIGTGYEDEMRRGEMGEIRRARGEVLAVVKALPKSKAGRLLDRLRGRGEGKQEVAQHGPGRGVWDFDQWM